MTKYTGILLILAMLGSCAPSKYAATEKAYRKQSKALTNTLRETPEDTKNREDLQWIGAIHFGLRKPNYVMIHHTAQNSLAQTINTFHSVRTGVSSHYVIGRDGTVVQMVHDLYRAHHAGLGKWGNDTDLNSSSIGIELDNNGIGDPWPEVQIQALVDLLATLKEKYKIPQANFIGHMDSAPTRKIDPANFPWKTLADSGFGFWYDEEKIEYQIPENWDPLLALRVIGYDMTNPNAAITAFKRHYVQSDNSPQLTERDLNILYQIFLQYR